MSFEERGTYETLFQEILGIALKFRYDIVFIIRRIVGVYPQPDPTKVEFSYETLSDLPCQQLSPTMRRNVPDPMWRVYSLLCPK
jgi:hypothetical protein